MQFELESTSDNTGVVVHAIGPVIEGDMHQLLARVAARPSGTQVLAIALDSPGGSVAEGVQIAEYIHDQKFPVIVPDGAKCASICFLMFAASPRRLAGPDALIGVHSAREHDAETTNAKAVTVELARLAAEYDVPPAIIGMMVETRPGHMEWLSPEALASMDVRLLPRSEPDAGAAPTPEAPTPEAPTPEAPTQERHARPRATASRPLPPLPPARPVAVVPAPNPAPPVIASGGPVFRGHLTCRHGDRVLQLDVTAIDNGAVNATMSLSPAAASRDADSGSFAVAGEIDLRAGTLVLRPVAWRARAGGALMLGLAGQSDDGGNTFTGHATSTTDCAEFTLSRKR